MSTPAYPSLREWFERLWNQGDESVVDEMLAPEAPVHGIPGPTSDCCRGAEAFKGFYRGFRAAFPDIRITVEKEIRSDDTLVARCTLAGTHRGDLAGLAPTGRPVRITGMVMARVENGVMAEGWNNFDLHSLFLQLGAPPAAIR
jgi:predicted ester cyclase